VIIICAHLLSTPQAARDEAINIVNAGGILDPGVAKNLIRKYKTAKTLKIHQKSFLN
jgi:spermidine/putrescine-binding protein